MRLSGALGPEVERPPESGSLDAGEARKIATQGAKKVAHDSQHKIPKARVLMANGKVSMRLPKRSPKKCLFAETQGCSGTHPSWKCRAFDNIAPKDRERINKDNKACSFCLLHGAVNICYAEISEMKQVCQRKECKGDHIQ
jgi:hypothetical protein